MNTLNIVGYESVDMESGFSLKRVSKVLHHSGVPVYLF